MTGERLAENSYYSLGFCHGRGRKCPSVVLVEMEVHGEGLRGPHLVNLGRQRVRLTPFLFEAL